MSLQLAGLVGCSFVDFPGELAAVLFLQGCNLRCPWCHNPELVSGPASAPIALDQALDHLRLRRGRIGAVVVSGGEPCLHPGLPELLREIRHLGYRIKLDTNGTRPDRLEAILSAGLVDHVAMDLKDIPEAYAAVGGPAMARCLRQSIALLGCSGTTHEFRTTVHLPRFDRRRLLLMADCLSACQRWYLQAFRNPGRILDPGADCRPPSRELLLAWSAALRARGLPCEVR